MSPWSARPRRFRRAVVAVSIVSVASLVLLGVAGTGLRAPRGMAQGTAGMRVSSSADVARAKVHPALREQAAASPEAGLLVHVYARVGTDVSRYMPQSVSRAFADPLGNTFISGIVKGADVLKVASIDGVIAVQPSKGAVQPALAPDATIGRRVLPSGELAAQMRAIMQAGKPNDASRQNPAQPTGWYDQLNNHQSALAWEKGYTGAGVTVMVNDSGIDFAHPDIYGTWAVVDDPSSPYYGWPMMFDSLSTLMLALDQIVGTNYVASGQSHYADTSTVVTEGASSYQPIGAAAAHTYTLPGTSLSGNYHIGTHPDTSLMDWYAMIHQPAEGEPLERPAVLVVDENTPGVYDTVYVDLNFNYDFTDDNPASKEQPVIAADWWGPMDYAAGDFDPNPDGLNDQSGGLIYFIADGVTPVPTTDWAYGLAPPANGSLVAFTILDANGSPGGDHGQLCVSNVVGQGVIDGDSYLYALAGDETGGVRPWFKPEGVGGMVVGAGKDVKVVSAGDYYSIGGEDWAFYAMIGYDGVPGSGDEVQIISNSWGDSFTNNDGWDFESRYIDLINRRLGPTTLIAFSVGNGSPGFGTVTSPAPPSGLDVGASTQHGSTGWDEPAGADQITWGDVAAFSGLGPSARGDQGVDILGDGSRASGNATLNESWSGAHAWYTWGGTSRAAPVVVGNAALFYQAFRESYGRWPDIDTAKSILMSGARDINYDPFHQGAGLVNGNRIVDIASGAAGFYVTPNAWVPGDYDGATWPGFTNILLPGESSETWLTVTNPTDNWLFLTAGDRWLQRQHTEEWTFTSSNIADEAIELVEDNPSATGYDWNMPHYVWDVTSMIPAGTDLMVFRQNYTYDQYDPAGTYNWQQVNDWYVLIYDWKDNNGDGNVWEDHNGDGTIQPDEYDMGELVRREYSNSRGNTAYVYAQTPLERSHDGVYIGLFHNQARADVPTTTMTLGLDFYDNVDFPWVDIAGELAVPPGGEARIKARVHVPGDTPAGMYEGAIWFNDGGWNTTVPVVVNVAGRGYNMTAGGNAGDGWYDNGQVYGAQSWRWRAESGDWRFYYADLGANPAGLDRLNGTEYWMVSADWGDLPTDVNVHIFGPALDDFSADEPGYYGPYTLQPIGGSNNGYVGAGVFLTQTSSGSSTEFVGAPYIPGLNLIAIDNVNYAGSAPSEWINLRAGVLSVSHSPITVSRSSNNANYGLTQTIVSTMDLSGLVVDGFGLSKPTVYAGQTVLQDDPDDPATASYTKAITLDHAGFLSVAIDGQDGDDLDLYLLYDANGDGAFDPTETIASSATAAPDEAVSITLPADGDYLIAVHGWSVPAGETTFDLAVNAVQGTSVQATGVPEGGILAGQRYSFRVEITAGGYEPGTYSGLITLGPPEGPAAVLIPVTFEVTE